MSNFMTQYNPRRVRGLKFGYWQNETKTHQQFKDEADINHLIDNYTRTGSFYDMRTLMRMKPRQPVFADFTNIPDFEAGQNIIARGSEMFELLPVKVRERFNNSPELLLAFLRDKSNADEAIKLGLIPAPVVDPAPIAPVPEPDKTVAVNE